MTLRRFIYLLFFSFVQDTFSQEFYIKGKVIDNESHLILKGASVYINNTTKGAMTDDNGNFEIGPLIPGRYEVVASYVGYEPLLYLAELKSASMRISFRLEKKEEVLREVLVLNSETRKRYLELFKKFVIGTTAAAEQCRIKNIDEVQFASGKEKDEIIGYTDKELEIDNPALGYTIYFHLLNFYYNKSTTGTHFFGYTRYVDWGKDEQTKKKWVRKRRQAYEGSTVHFLRSVINKNLEKQGFTVYQLNNMQKPKKDSMGTIISQPGNTGIKIAARIVEDSMIRVYPDSNYRIYELMLNNGWRVFYAKNTTLKIEVMKKSFLSGQPLTGTMSGLRLREEPAFINERGIILTPIRLFYDGIWGYERLAHMLPVDYEEE